MEKSKGSMDDMRERIEVIGQVLRWITPVMMAIIGFMSVHYLTEIDYKFKGIDTKFDFFISTYHDVDKRVDRLEYMMIEEKDGKRRKN